MAATAVKTIGIIIALSAQVTINYGIIWLCPARMGEMAKIYEKTSEILQLHIIKA